MEKNTASFNNELRKEAIALGLCKKWQGEWQSDWDISTLFERYFQGIDFCYKNDYPSNKFIKENVSKDILRLNGVLVDDTYSLLNQRNISLLGYSSSTIRINAYNISNVWMKDNSNAKIMSSGKSGAFVHVFDFCTLNVVADDYSEVFVFVHSNDCEITTEEKNGGKINVVREIGYLGRN